MSDGERISAWWFPVMLVLTVPFALFHGWAWHLLWAWFVVPFGAPVIGTAWMAGLALMLGLAKRRDSDDSGAKSPGEQIVTDLLLYLIALGAGWILHAMMA